MSGSRQHHAPGAISVASPKAEGGHLHGESRLAQERVELARNRLLNPSRKRLVPRQRILVSESFQRRSMRIEEEEPVITGPIPHRSHFFTGSPFRIKAVITI